MRHQTPILRKLRLMLTLSRLDSLLGLHSEAAAMQQHWYGAVLQGSHGLPWPVRHAPGQALDPLAEASNKAQQAQRLQWDRGSQAMPRPSQCHTHAARHDCASILVLARRMVGFPPRTSA